MKLQEDMHLTWICGSEVMVLWMEQHATPSRKAPVPILTPETRCQRQYMKEPHMKNKSLCKITSTINEKTVI